MPKKQLQLALDKQVSVSLGQAWAREDIAMRTEEGEVSVRIVSADVCFNLNALATSYPMDDAEAEKPPVAREQQIFMLLLTNLGVAEPQAGAIADAVIMKIGTQRGTSETGYLIEDVSELREIGVISRELYLRIAPLVCALPDKTLRINLNTATAQQLPLIRAMLLNALGNEQLLAIIAGRPQLGWSSLDFLTTDNYPELGKLKNDGLADRLATTGNRFTAELQLKLDDGRYRLVSALQRNSSGTEVIRRQFGWGEH
ncbi:Type II secretory pathway, component PulK [Serratia plymuthica]|nr:Type II secretory pathway, component PulK [Serratia plymuthica]